MLQCASEEVGGAVAGRHLTRSITHNTTGQVKVVWNKPVLKIEEENRGVLCCSQGVGR